MTNLLDGITVIDWTQAHNGAATGYMLGDLGADVIKVEDPQGDLARTFRSIMGVSMDLPGGRNVLFEGANRNKRSITLNLKSPEGNRLFRELVGRADVVVTNYRRGVRQRLGLDYDDLAPNNPRLIYGVASGYGEQGFAGDERSYDNTAFAWSGMMHLIGEDESPPLYMTPGAADQLGATMLAQGILGALYWRERTGQGQRVEASLLGALVHFLALPLNNYLMGGRVPKRPTRNKIFNPLVGWYQCADDRWLMFSLNQPQQSWHDFCEALTLGEEVENNPKFNSTRSRADNCEELIAILDRVAATRPRDEWLSRCRARDLICAPVNSVQDIADDEQLAANGYIFDLDHEVLGNTKTIGFPITFSQVQQEVKAVAPELGQHTEEILLDIGYSWDDISDFQEKGAI
jgi:crotonobetainyl-CoA:carnitine CoA-transferase CaiB-like acyl-CoA transferase